MKKALLTSLSSILLFSFVSAHQFVPTDCIFTVDGQTFAKIYVDASQVFISKNTITVNLGKESICPDTIYSDGKGVFFVLPSTEVWQCPSCEITINFASHSHCSNCGSIR
ncbi:MAG: hypothetical protein KF898_05225 [Parachlamydiales bacterium]|nr:hypothetical protein [Verrucomicrobiota bacterium]MBX3719030.1 hypothetical protein [Candidatus Acheromyda pituitae]